MNKSRIKKWVKNVIVTISILIVIIVLTYFIYKKLSNINRIANQCDKEYGYTCDYYELKKYILEGNSNGR